MKGSLSSLLGVLVLSSACVAEDAAKVELKPIDLAGFNRFIADNKGKPVAVDVWATYCQPCRKKFPTFVARAAAQKGKVVFASLSFDEASKNGPALKFLSEQNAAFANFRITDDVDEVQKKLGFEDQGVPRYLLYDADGKQVHNGNDLHEMEQALDKLLEKAGK